jgi:hypothetical protein
MQKKIVKYVYDLKLLNYAREERLHHSNTTLFN